LQAAIVPVTQFEQNCTLLWDEATRRGTVVDPGGDADRILAAIDQVGMQPLHILLTHGHLDHAGGAAALQESLQARLGGPVPIEGPDERDRFLLDSLAQQAARFGFPGMRNVQPTRWLREGDTVDIAGHAFAVLHCPGHTPGHVVFVNPGLKLALVGDVLFQGSVGRTDFPYGDTAALLRSIREKLLPLDDEVAFICGHGPSSTIGAERRSNPFLRGARNA
jgi:glyoxylase-like metal-dependent hydrolase (beta-lactamase superfamily II)